MEGCGGRIQEPSSQTSFAANPRGSVSCAVFLLCPLRSWGRRSFHELALRIADWCVFVFVRRMAVRDAVQSVRRLRCRPWKAELKSPPGGQPI